MGTKNNPGKFDAHDKAHPDEPMFTLLGRDPMAAEIVQLWAIARRQRIGHLDDKAMEAMVCANQMREWCVHRARRIPAHPLLSILRLLFGCGRTETPADLNASELLFGGRRAVAPADLSASELEALHQRVAVTKLLELA